MKILIFAPHAAIWVHAFPEALVGEALKRSGHEIVYVTCGGLFERYCVAMSANRLGFTATHTERRKVCDQCMRNERLLRHGFEFSGPVLRDLLTPTEVNEAESIVASVDRTSFQHLIRDGVPLGRVALYQIIIRRKLQSFEFNDEEWQEYLIELRHTLYSWLAGRRLLDAHRPDRVIVYNGLYSVNRAFCLLAEARGIPAYFLHAGGNLSNRLQTLMFGRGHTFSYFPHLLEQWPRFNNLPCGPELLSQVTDHYLQLFNATSVFVYSKRKSARSFDVRVNFDVSPLQKILVATMGSIDEEMAAEVVGARTYRKPRLFDTQIDWIRAITEFVGERPDLFLIIRVHPREFPNQRDGAKSQHAGLLQLALQDLPSNVAVNWPQDGVSLYDFVDVADVFLNSWSSVGKEMALLGIPVVIYSDEVPFYPSELNYFGDTKESYFAAIDHALSEGWSAENVRRSYRWAAYEFVRTTLLIEDGFNESETRRRSIPTRLIERVQRVLDGDFRKRRDLRRRPVSLKAAKQIIDVIESGACSVIDRVNADCTPQATMAEEENALRNELGRLGRALFPTPQAQAQSRLYKRLSDPTLFR